VGQTGQLKPDDQLELWQSCNDLTQPRSSEIVLQGEPNFFCIKQLRSLGRAFGSRPNAWVCEVKSGLQVGEVKALFCN
jgi:hypothetical protein